jgi:hypothetical protein
MRSLLSKLEEGDIAKVKANIRLGAASRRPVRSCKNEVVDVAEEMGFDVEVDGNIVIIQDDTSGWEVMLDATRCEAGVSTIALNLRPTGNYKQTIITIKDMSGALNRLARFLEALEGIAKNYKSDLRF